MTKQSYRGTGLTTEQLKNAPINCIFVWCNYNLSYPKELIQKLGRTDIHVISPDQIHNYLIGMSDFNIIFDHACTEKMKQSYHANYRHRSQEAFA